MHCCCTIVFVNSVCIAFIGPEIYRTSENGTQQQRTRNMLIPSPNPLDRNCKYERAHSYTCMSRKFKTLQPLCVWAPVCCNVYKRASACMCVCVCVCTFVYSVVLMIRQRDLPLDTHYNGGGTCVTLRRPTCFTADTTHSLHCNSQHRTWWSKDKWTVISGGDGA